MEISFPPVLLLLHRPRAFTSLPPPSLSPAVHHSSHAQKLAAAAQEGASDEPSQAKPAEDARRAKISLWTPLLPLRRRVPHIRVVLDMA
jgi:hypothetical protein